jgi:hypothetical protein
MASSCMGWRIVVVSVLFSSGYTLHAWAHDLITPEYTEKQLGSIARNVLVLNSAEPASKRAEAAYQIGSLLDDIAALLNHDVASQGEVQGEASSSLVTELKARGTPLSRIGNGRFLANIDYYRQSLKLAPQGPREADALFKLTQSYFYDGFDAGPLGAKQPPLEQIQEQILLGERLTQRYPNHGDTEETRFILLVHYVQAAKSATDRELKSAMTQKARAAITDFLARYPKSLRAVTLPLFTQTLDAK